MKKEKKYIPDLAVLALEPMPLLAAANPSPLSSMTPHNVVSSWYCVVQWLRWQLRPILSSLDST
jgi:hypothetical protein